MLLLATNSTYHALRVTPITMGRLVAILPFHQPITRTHKRNRSPPLSGSQKTAPPVGLGLASASGQDLAVPPRNAFQEDVPPLRRNETERDGGGGAAGGGGGGGGGGTRPARWWSWRKWKAKKPGRWTCSPSTRLALKNHLIACMGEFVGTVLFLFLALGTASVANLMATSVTGTAASSGKGAAPNTSSLFYIATGAGLSLTVTTFTFSRISGALFSPAVSLGMALVGALTPSRAILLTCVQFLGGICAAALVNVLTPGSQNYTTRLGPAMSVVRGLFLEVMLTACLMLTM
ncbi:Aquaporin-1 [Rhodotorula sphaerocarpa]